MTIKTPILLAIGAVVAFPLLQMAGFQVKSSYIVTVTLIVGGLALFVVWRVVRQLFAGKER